MRARICELRSLGWSYDHIRAKHPNIPKSTIGDTCRQEAKRLNNASQPRPGSLRVITEGQRDMLYESAASTPSISYEALQAQVAPDALIRSIKQLFQEVNIHK